MLLLFLDEFGHFSRQRQNAAGDEMHPAFGYGGILIPASEFEYFSSNFLRFKSIPNRHILSVKTTLNKITDVENLHRARLYEAKGNDVFSVSYMNKEGVDSRKKYNVWNYGVQFLNLLKSCGAEIVYVGVDKKYYFEDLSRNPKRKLHVHFIKNVCEVAHSYAKRRGTIVQIVFDHHMIDEDTKERMSARTKSQRIDLDPNLQTRFEYAQQIITDNKMYNYIREPLTSYKSDWSLAIQAADWVCSLLGHISYYVSDASKRDRYESFYNRFHDRIQELKIEESRYYTSAKDMIEPERQLVLL